MDIKAFIKSQQFRGIIIGLSIALVALIIFQAGIAVGERRSNFVHRFGDNFERNFRNPDSRMMFDQGFPGGGPLPGGHGAVGEIISIALPNIVVSGPDNLEKTIVIGDDTVVREFQNEITGNDLQVGDYIVTLGEPNEEGQIEAKLIRLLPPPPNVPIHNQPNTE